MLFNSLPFIFAFFPLAVLVFFAVGSKNHLFACVWLCAASLFFYGWWNPSFLSLLMGSVIFNYAAAYLMSREIGKPERNNGRLLLIFAVAENLLLLGYFKYAGFFTEIVNTLFRSNVDLGQIVLPLGISFFTFTQIAFLVDVYQGKTKEPNFIHWHLFVTYFPHLIAGPIIHHARIMPQFARPETYRINWLNTSAGFTGEGASTLRFFATSSQNALYVGPIVLLGLAAIWLLPNTQEFMRSFKGFDQDVPPAAGFAGRIVWQPYALGPLSCSASFSRRSF
jgi:hypothetical protein